VLRQVLDERGTWGGGCAVQRIGHRGPRTGKILGPGPDSEGVVMKLAVTSRSVNLALVWECI